MQERSVAPDIRSGHVSVVGLGKLGAPLAAVLASRGFTVIGTDRNPKLVAALAAGQAPVAEPGLQQLIAEARGRLEAAAETGAAVRASDATFVVVPTPSGADGAFSNAHVLAAVRDIGASLRGKPGYHLVVVSSTVMPGSMDGPIREALEAASGRRVGEHLGLCYSPEFIALGSVIRDMLNPDFVLIGESDARAGETLAAIHRAVCGNAPPIRRMNFVNAELAKIAVNAFVTAKISFANMLSELCDRLPDADAATVAAALGGDSRIGAKYLSPALGFGGPCFPRDNAALASLARALGAAGDLAEATDRVNHRQPDRVVALVRGLIARGTVGILGLSYKPHTPVIEESQGIAIAARLADAGYRVLIFDPEALGPAAAVLGGKAEPVASAEECAARADVLVIATAWPAFRDLPPRALYRADGRLPVIDCWRLLPPDTFAAAVELIHLGRPHPDRPAAGAATALRQ
jgi:UDPglucose 6-dehydrogenase